MEELDPHDIKIKDHVEKDIEHVCAYCGKPFMSIESRIEKRINGRKWVFCSEECLERFCEEIDFKDENPDMRIDETDTGFDVAMTFTGPKDED